MSLPSSTLSWQSYSNGTAHVHNWQYFGADAHFRPQKWKTITFTYSFTYHSRKMICTFLSVSKGGLRAGEPFLWSTRDFDGFRSWMRWMNAVASSFAGLCCALTYASMLSTLSTSAVILGSEIACVWTDPFVWFLLVKLAITFWTLLFFITFTHHILNCCMDLNS